MPSGERCRVSYTVFDAMSCIRRARVPVPCAELALRSARTDGLGDRFTVQPFTPTATGGSSCNDAQRRPDVRRHATWPPSWIQRENWEFETHRPSEALIQAIVELKSRNPRFGCPRMARIISRTFGATIDKNVVCRVLSTHYRPIPGGTGPSWLSFIGHTTDSLWSVDLFRCESIVLRSYWGLVVMDQFTASPRRRRRAPRSGHWRRPLPHVQRRHSWAGHPATPQHRS